jgi:hypothetical protein
MKRPVIVRRALRVAHERATVRRAGAERTAMAPAIPDAAAGAGAIGVVTGATAAGGVVTGGVVVGGVAGGATGQSSTFDASAGAAAERVLPSCTSAGPHHSNASTEWVPLSDSGTVDRAFAPTVRRERGRALGDGRTVGGHAIADGVRARRERGVGEVGAGARDVGGPRVGERRGREGERRD